MSFDDENDSKETMPMITIPLPLFLALLSGDVEVTMTKVAPDDPLEEKDGLN